MLKDIIQSFLPWILYFVLAGHTQQQLDIAIIVAAVTSLFFEFNGLKKGFILSWGTLIYFVFLFIAVILLRHPWVIKYSWLLSNGALAAIAWISILIRQPFTIQYAREQVSQDKWHHPLFLKINYLLTMVWGLIFSLGIGLHFIKIYYPAFNGWTYQVISYIPSIFGIWFTTWFPNWYKEKQQQSKSALKLNE